MKQVFLSLLVFLSFQACAQESCTEKLYNANKLYENGQIAEAIESAKSCTTSENETDRWKAYRLLAMAYISINELREARKAAEVMKEINPTYVPSNTNDPAELAKLLEEVIVLPKLSMIAPSIGYNITTPSVLTTFNAASYQKEYTSGQGWSYGLILGYTMNKRISLGFGLLVNQKNYGIQYQVGDNKIEIDEKMNYLNLPLFARFYTNPIKKIRFFAETGIYSGLRTSSQSNFLLTNSERDESTKLTNLNSDGRRNNWEYGGIFGLGLVRSYNKFDVAFDLKYYVPRNKSITEKSSRYSHPDLLYNYHYLDDDIRLNVMSISFSIVYNFSYRVIRSKK